MCIIESVRWRCGSFSNCIRWWNPGFGQPNLHQIHLRWVQETVWSSCTVRWQLVPGCQVTVEESSRRNVNWPGNFSAAIHQTRSPTVWDGELKPFTHSNSTFVLKLTRFRNGYNGDLPHDLWENDWMMALSFPSYVPENSLACTGTRSLSERADRILSLSGETCFTIVEGNNDFCTIVRFTRYECSLFRWFKLCSSTKYLKSITGDILSKLKELHASGERINRPGWYYLRVRRNIMLWARLLKTLSGFDDFLAKQVGL